MEFQSNPDSTMVIRMVEYDFSIAMQYIEVDNGKYIMKFPESCIIYLRHNRNTKDTVEMEIQLAGNQKFTYRVPVIKVQEYTKDTIFQKKLLFLLPFYIVRYEKQAANLEKDEEKLDILLKEYEDIRERLDAAYAEEDKTREYQDLIELIIRISDYIFRESEKPRKGVAKVMGGEVLELGSERYDRGFRDGEIRGEIKVYFKMGFPIKEIAEKTGRSVEKINEILKELEMKQ